jgi:hypothetical protein
MDTELVKKVRAAAGATWVVLLIGVIWMTAAYLVWLAFMHTRPAWLLTLAGGGGFDWGDYQLMAFGFFGLVKLGLFVLVGVAIWLTLFSRRLERGG